MVLCLYGGVGGEVGGGFGGEGEEICDNLEGIMQKKERHILT